MRRAWIATATLCMLAGCKRELDLGSAPHLVGELESFDWDASQYDLEHKYPSLTAHGEVGKTVVANASYDKSGKPDAVYVHGARSVDDVVRAWGPGTAALVGDEPARQYLDPARGIEYLLQFDLEAPTGRGFLLRAHRYRPLATLLDETPSLDVSGVTLLGRSLDDARTALAAKGITVHDMPELTSALGHDVLWTDDGLDTEYGDWKMMLMAHGQSVDVVELTLYSDTRGSADDILARLSKKWGTPTANGDQLTYPARGPTITAELTGFSVDLTIRADRPE